MSKNKKIKNSPSNQNQKDEKYLKKPLFKIFMDENNNKKLHLIKNNNISNSKDTVNPYKHYEGL